MSKLALDREAVRQMLLRVADRLIASEPLLSEADRQLGDGDHGLGMARGFTAVQTKLMSGGDLDIGKLFASSGTAMLSTMGGASGALFGTLFRAGAKAVEGRESFDARALADFLEAADSAVMARGGAKPGNKTMIDALHPAAETARSAASLSLEEAIVAAAAAAQSGAQATRSMQAAVGRAKSLGELSLGHPDAGALSVSLILTTMRDYIVSSEDCPSE